MVATRPNVPLATVPATNLGTGSASDPIAQKLDKVIGLIADEKERAAKKEAADAEAKRLAEVYAAKNQDSKDSGKSDNSTSGTFMSFLVLLLFASMFGNVYFGWSYWGIRERYQMIADQRRRTREAI